MSDAPYKEAPTATPIQAVAIDQTHDANGIRLGAWSAEICGCFTDLVPNCLMATCCPCISLAQISHRMNVARYAYVLLTFLVLVLLEVLFGALSFAAQMDSMNDTIESWNDGYYSYEVSTSGVAFGSASNLASSAVSIIYIILIWQLRSKVRERFQIPGSCCEDYCCVWWCSCCTIAQMATHVKSYKPSACDFGPPDMLPAFD